MMSGGEREEIEGLIIEDGGDLEEVKE